MNFLFTTVLVLLLVAPGLSFFRFYYAGRFSVRYSNLTITDQIFRSIVPGLLLQAILIWFINRYHPLYYTIHLDLLGTLLLGAKEDRTVQAAFKLVESNLGSTILYEMGLLLGSAASGWGVRELVRWRKLDRRTRLLRYDNEWHYLLTGEILETDDFSPLIQLRDATHIDFVAVDALVKLENGNILYSGILASYELAADGGLRTIYLLSAQRKQLGAVGEGESESEDYYPVIGDLLTIPYAQLLNLNIRYFLDEEDAAAEGDNSLAALGSDNTQISVSGEEDIKEEGRDEER